MIPEVKYTTKGFLDVGSLYNSPYPYIVVISSRGGGKTYGTLKWLVENKHKFIYFRRTKQILEIISDPAYHPFKRLNMDMGWKIRPKPSKGLTILIDDDSNTVVGYMAALSVFSNLRGWDASDVSYLVFDEWVPEPTDRVTYNMFTAWTNAIETVNRNREMLGEDSVRIIMLSNSDLIYGDIIAGFHIGDELMMMQESGTEVFEHSNDMLLVMPSLSFYTEQKADTPLYRLTQGSEFERVALNNKFMIEDRSSVCVRPLREYNPVCVIRGVCFYKHKSGNHYYATTQITGNPIQYQDTKTDMRRFLQNHRSIGKAYIKKRLFYSGIDVQGIVRKIYS